MGYASCAQLIMPGSGPNHLKKYRLYRCGAQLWGDPGDRRPVRQRPNVLGLTLRMALEPVREPVPATAVGDAAECRATATIPAREPACGIA